MYIYVSQNTRHNNTYDAIPITVYQSSYKTSFFHSFDQAIKALSWCHVITADDRYPAKMYVLTEHANAHGHFSAMETTLRAAYSFISPQFSALQGLHMPGLRRGCGMPAFSGHVAAQGHRRRSCRDVHAGHSRHAP
jgi:hypothetical protein